MPELHLKHVVKVLSDRNRTFRLEIPDFQMRPGGRIAILGPTGSGKTTAMDLLALAGRPTSAASFLLTDEGHATIDLARRQSSGRLAKLRGRYFGYVLQSGPLFSFLTIRENAALCQRIARRVNRGLVEELLQAMDLRAAADGRIGDLSVGQRQKLSVVRALAHRPPFILCDEPTASLDPDSADALIRSILQLAALANACVVIITHDHRLPRMHGFDIFRMRALAGQAGSVLVPDGGAPA